MPYVREPFCQKCGMPIQGGDTCETCRLEPPAYQLMRSWAVFDSPIQDGLHTMKYRRNKAFGESIAAQMLGFVRLLRWPVQILIPVPLGKKRLQERGYNQVALVAQPLAYAMGWRYEPQALWKTRETRSQVGLSISQRRENVDNAYQADATIVRAGRVLLMDDVATTGSTISACTHALLSAGAQDVFVLTIARALAHHSLNRV